MEKFANINKMSISSISSFMSVNGRFDGSVKDSYFLRYIGYDDKVVYSNDILKADVVMKDKIKDQSAGYYRTENLVYDISNENFKKYERVYQNYKVNNTIDIDFKFPKMMNLKELCLRFNYIISIYANYNKNDIANFAVKILYWMDIYFPKVFLEKFDYRHSPKFIITENANIYEYLFLYLLSLCGCDVLCIDTRADFALDDELLSLSKLIKFSQCGDISIPSYKEEGQKIKLDLTRPDRKNANIQDMEDEIGIQEVQNTIKADDNFKNPVKESTVEIQGQENNEGLNTNQEKQNIDNIDSKENTIQDSINNPENKDAKNDSKSYKINLNRLDIPINTSQSSNNEGAINLNNFKNIDSSKSEKENKALNLSQRSGTKYKIDTLKHNKKYERRLLNYEEVARLSGSVVMIEAFDSDGEFLHLGSGVMIGQNGYILTNYHVIKASRFSIKIEDDEKVYHTDMVVKYHQDFDLAVIKIDKTLRPLRLYNEKEKLVKGQKVVVIGSQLGLFNSVSDGIIGGFRTFDDVSTIQFTAPTLGGNSGGALLNMYGELIGIVSFGLSENLNLAIDYETIRFFARGFLDSFNL